MHGVAACCSWVGMLCSSNQRHRRQPCGLECPYRLEGRAWHSGRHATEASVWRRDPEPGFCSRALRGVSALVPLQWGDWCQGQITCAGRPQELVQGAHTAVPESSLQERHDDPGVRWAAEEQELPGAGQFWKTSRLGWDNVCKAQERLQTRVPRQMQEGSPRIAVTINITTTTTTTTTEIAITF